MGNLTWFEEERDIGFRDRELYEFLRPHRKRSSWVEQVCDWYETPKKKPYMARDLKLSVAKNRDGFPKLTFAVFDGCKLHGYWDSAGVRELLPLLRTMGHFLEPPRKDTFFGVATFRTEGVDHPFSFVADYANGAISARYCEPRTLAFDDVAPIAPLPESKTPRIDPYVEAQRKNDRFNFTGRVWLFVRDSDDRYCLLDWDTGVYEGTLGSKKKPKRTPYPKDSKAVVALRARIRADGFERVTNLKKVVEAALAHGISVPESLRQ